MLELLQDLAGNTVGVRATGEVNKQEYEQVLMPALDALSEKANKINLLLLLETDISHFTPGAWMNDLIIGLKHFTKWHRVALVTEQKGVQKFTDIFSHFVPGQYKGFSINELGLAKQWVTE